MPNLSGYSLALIGATLITATWWCIRHRSEPRLKWIYLGGLLGAFAGAKVVYLLSEGWMHVGAPNMWLHFATGKSVIGALFGGYGGVELMKKQVGYNRATGDGFALVVPMGIITGRVGCLVHGCCLGRECPPAWFTMRCMDGVARWPAVAVEILFNLVMIAVLFVMRRRQWLPDQHFHVYLIAYGVFRFLHEFARETPALAGPFSGYQFWSALLVAFGLFRYQQRAAASERSSSDPLPA